MRSLLVPLTLLLGGCSASVTAEAIDGGFGLLAGAALVRTDDGDNEYESVLISSAGVSCAAYTEMAEAGDEFYDAAFDVMNSDYCEDLEEPFLAYAKAFQAVFPLASRLVVISVSEGDFDEEDYDKGEWSGSVGLVEEVPYEDAVEDFDADGDQLDGCGLGADGLDGDFGDSWTLKGDLEVTSVEKAGPVVGDIDADMHDEDGDEDGEFTASFTAPLCEIDL